MNFNVWIKTPVMIKLSLDKRKVALALSSEEIYPYAPRPTRAGTEALNNFLASVAKFEVVVFLRFWTHLWV